MRLAAVQCDIYATDELSISHHDRHWRVCTPYYQQFVSDRLDLCSYICCWIRNVTALAVSCGHTDELGMANPNQGLATRPLQERTCWPRRKPALTRKHCCTHKAPLHLLTVGFSTNTTQHRTHAHAHHTRPANRLETHLLPAISGCADQRWRPSTFEGLTWQMLLYEACTFRFCVESCSSGFLEPVRQSRSATPAETDVCPKTDPTSPHCDIFPLDIHMAINMLFVLVLLMSSSCQYK